MWLSNFSKMFSCIYCLMAVRGAVCWLYNPMLDDLQLWVTYLLIEEYIWISSSDRLLGFLCFVLMYSQSSSECSISVGSIGNSYPPSSSTRSLLMADIRCLPGVSNKLDKVVLDSCILLILIA